MRTGTLEDLVDAVERHYASSEQPLLVSRLGQMLGGVSFRGFGGLGAAIREAGAERLAIINPTGAVGADVVALPGDAADRTARMRNRDLARTRAAQGFDALPVPVRLAFCVGAPGESVALTVRPPFRYVRLPGGDPPRTDLVLVDERFRHPGLNLRAASEGHREALWHSFLEWTKEHGVRPAVFAARPSGSEDVSALDRFIQAQDADIRGRLRVPDDIAEILRAHR